MGKGELVVRLTLTIFCLFLWGQSYGQKPLITLETYKTWQQVVGGDLTEDGNFALYSVTNLPAGKRTTFIKNTSGKLLHSFVNMNQARFSGDSRIVAGVLLGDTLIICNLLGGKRVNFPGVSTYKFDKWNGKEAIFANGKNGDLKILDFSGKTVYQVANCQEYISMVTCNSVITLTKDINSDNFKLRWTDCGSGKSDVIYAGIRISNLIADHKNFQIAFLLVGEANKIGYFKLGMKMAELIASEGDFIISPGKFWSFNNAGSSIYFSVVEKEILKTTISDINLEIWSYQDSYLQSYYNGSGPFGKNIGPKSNLAAVDLATRQIKQLTKEDQYVLVNPFHSGKDEYFVVESNASVRSDKWRNGLGRCYHLCEVKSGKMVALKEQEIFPLYRWNVSPSGKFIVYFDYKTRNYICYEIATKVKRNISSTITGGLSRYDRLYYPNPERYAVGVVDWLANDEAVLIQGTFDLWRVDPLAKSKPINLSAGEGEKNKIIFSPAFKNTNRSSLGNDYLLTAFDTKNKDFGFYISQTSLDKGIAKLSLGRRYIEDIYTPLKSFMLKHSKKGYLVYMEQSDHAPNYYFSKDLKVFSGISDIRPELNWNWVKTELLTYKDSLGNELQGMLYKPEDFDVAKKYPVIFSVYELKSNRLNCFPSPDLVGATFTLPWLVSNGYLVFMPDVKAVPRFGGDGVTRCIVAGADHLAQYKWVDTTRMGITGHSVGGFVTNYAITHCNRFKAAVSGAGISDMVRAATDVPGSGESAQEFLKDAAYVMQVDLSDDVPAYVRNSPILAAKHLTTPLLLLHNDQDPAVRFEHSRSFFIVLRNLQKAVWWLNYSGQDHQVWGEKAQTDYNTKVKEFFDHYLKGAPVPRWMKEHI